MIFEYTGINKDGVQAKGMVEAVNKNSAITTLQSRGITIISLKEEKKSVWGVDIIKKRVKNKDIVLFSRQIATLFEARVPAYRAFVLMTSQVSNPALADILTQVSESIKKGVPIANSLAEHEEAFSPFYVNMVAVGEEAGTLNTSFLRLADYLERSYDVTRKIKGALIYPAFVILTFVGVMWIMFGFVIPQIATILVDSGAELPFITSIMLAISDFVAGNSLLLFIFILILLGGIFQYSRTKQGKKFFDFLKLSTPIIGRLYRNLYLSRIANNISLMLTSGVQLLRATEVTAKVVDNVIYEKMLIDASKKIKGGSSFASVLDTHSDLIPPLMSQMSRVGEETGELSSMMASAANFYENELKDYVDATLKLIEPLLIVFLGLAVSILMASVLLPIYTISSQF
ncbi:MAG: type II secretion system F family protein [Candidatus Campbellbacteria bacterium]|nr:type II secretion system F family protein [Candidatus Campbellbacteria bacterium]